MPSSHDFRAAAAQAKLESARAEAIRAQAEAERARAESEKVRAEADRARMAEERATRIAAEESARKTQDQEARIKADKRAVENQHLAAAIVGGLTAGKVTAKLTGKAAEKRVQVLKPQMKALAKEAKTALAGSGTKNHAMIRAIAATTPSAKGSMALGASALFVGDALLGFHQAAAMREQGDEDAARNLETFARANTIAGVSAPLLRWDQEKNASKFVDLKDEATLKAAKIAAEGPAGPEPKKPRKTNSRPALAKAAEQRQKAIAASEAAPAAEAAKALPAPTEAPKAEAAVAKAAGPTKTELQAAAKAAFQDHPNPAQLRAKLGPWYKFDKNALAAVMRDAKIPVPGYGLKYAVPLAAGAAFASSLVGSSGEAEARPLTERLKNAAADAGTALRGLVPTNAREAAELATQFAFPAVGTGVVVGVESARNSQGVADVAHAVRAGDWKAAGQAYHDLSMDIAHTGKDLAVGVAQGVQGAAHYVAGARGNRARYAQEAAERHASGYGTAPSAHELVSSYVTHRGGHVTTAHFSPGTLAARAQRRSGQ